MLDGWWRCEVQPHNASVLRYCAPPSVQGFAVVALQQRDEMGSWRGGAELWQAALVLRHALLHRCRQALVLHRHPTGVHDAAALPHTGELDDRCVN